MAELIPALLFIALIALFWELTVHNISRILTKKYTRAKTIFWLLFSLAGVMVISAVISVISRIITSIGLIENISVEIIILLLIVAAIFLTSHFLYKENFSTVFFVASFFMLLGTMLCDITLNFVNHIFPQGSYGTTLYFVVLSIIIIIFGIVSAIIVKIAVAPAMKELIKNTKGKLSEFVIVSTVGIITYVPMIIYFNSFAAADNVYTNIISRVIFLAMYVTIYFLIIFGVRRSMKTVRIRDDLRLAKEIQDQILPSQKTMDEIPGVKIAALMSPYQEVGGDFYDAFIVDEDRSAFIIADVAGKGIPAALFMMQVKSLLKVNLRMDKMPDYALTASNMELTKKRNDYSMYYGAVVSVFNTKTRVYTYSCGGSFPPVLIRNGSAVEMKYSGDSEVGIADTIYSQFEVTLEKDDMVFLYTDGIVDTLSPAGMKYGKKRLADLIYKETEPDKIISAVMEDIAEFSENREQTDDITMIVFKVL